MFEKSGQAGPSEPTAAPESDTEPTGTEKDTEGKDTDAEKADGE